MSPVLNQQLRQVNIRKILGNSVKSSQIAQGLKDIISITWTKFMAEEVEDKFSEQQLFELTELVSNPESKPEDFFSFMRTVMPDFNRRFQEKLLESKAEIIRGRIIELADSLEEQTTNELNSLMKQGDWLKLEQKLVALQS
ncbi:MAG: hypothetical protein GF390_04045 [Candidatus Pacebacteria bacterium]|nr:hypothetical protein [Candidatus Paceibacterota bacterium]